MGAGRAGRGPGAAAGEGPDQGAGAGRRGEFLARGPHALLAIPEQASSVSHAGHVLAFVGRAGEGEGARRRREGS